MKTHDPSTDPRNKKFRVFCHHPNGGAWITLFRPTWASALIGAKWAFIAIRGYAPMKVD